MQEVSSILFDALMWIEWEKIHFLPSPVCWYANMLRLRHGFLMISQQEKPNDQGPIWLKWINSNPSTDK